MGYLRPSVLVVGASYGPRLEDGPDEHWAEIAHAKVREILAAADSELARSAAMVPLSLCLSQLSPPLWNRERSFAVWWCGSNEGWPPAEAFTRALEQITAWLREQCYEDGSSPLDWVWLRYGGHDNLDEVLDSSARQFHEVREGRPSVRELDSRFPA